MKELQELKEMIQQRIENESEMRKMNGRTFALASLERAIALHWVIDKIGIMQSKHLSK